MKCKFILVMLVLLLPLGIVISYSPFGAPSEFGNETNTTCWIGGDFGNITCIGKLIVADCEIGNLNVSKRTTTNEFIANNYYLISSKIPFNFYDDGTNIMMNMTATGDEFAVETDNSKYILFNEPKASNDFKVFQVFSKEAQDVTEFVVTKKGVGTKEEWKEIVS